METERENEPSYPCPCCGHVVFSDPPGSNDICLICFWEDDIAQLRWPDLAGGSNMPSLREAQRNFLKFGAIEERFVGDVRRPSSNEPHAPDWRPISDADLFETLDESAPFPDDATELYYWRRVSPASLSLS